jgi:hypothetical protein
MLLIGIERLNRDIDDAQNECDALVDHFTSSIASAPTLGTF